MINYTKDQIDAMLAAKDYDRLVEIQAAVLADLTAAWALTVYTVWLNRPTGLRHIQVAAESLADVQAMYASDHDLIAIQDPSDDSAAVTIHRYYDTHPRVATGRATDTLSVASATQGVPHA